MARETEQTGWRGEFILLYKSGFALQRIDFLEDQDEQHEKVEGGNDRI